MEYIEKYFGRMNSPSGSSCLKGPCGDEMEFYLDIKDNKIIDIKYYTCGCDATKSCGAITAHLVKGKTLEESLCVSACEVKKNIPNLSQDHLHCSILAVSAFYRAVADYILKY
ncbi:MAG: iron-sulfur cluster assembly scaffold protein [Endomicrobiia bacterium]|nr:iron-sulfur cluster assembly scaffold protein [Endomicrobiaceae bacterium]MDD3052987.1 iron-sulfur cluster assembly scaffold protein [Endomicrobiaceae bacterium]MDD5101685.1 iron-sulfur cluster assembly scaffold protein [Endomicrobiaceae bacterium]